MFTQKSAVLLLLAGGIANAETHSLTLQQAPELAARQNPHVTVARLDEQRAEEGIAAAKPCSALRSTAAVGSRIGPKHTMRDVEQAHLEEGNKWMAWYDAETHVARAKFAILRQTGNLLAVVHGGVGAARANDSHF